MKFNPCFMPLAAVLCTSLLFSCTSDLELPPLPPPPPPDNSIESSDNGSSSSGGSISGGSSSSVASSSLACATWGVWEETTPATCAAAGLKTRTCTSNPSIPAETQAIAKLEYEHETQFCHNGKIGDFCGTRTETFDPDLYECRTGGKIYLKNGLTDSRNSKTYDAVLLGTQTWMAENLNYKTTDGNSRCYPTSGSTQTSDADEGRCATYGRLYNWATAMNGAASSTANPSGRQGVCPSGWHLPSNAEWNALMKHVNPDCADNSNCAGAGTKLKASSGWNSGGVAGTDDYGFSALPGGFGTSNGNFYNVGDGGYWWSATENGSNDAYRRDMYYSREDVYYNSTDKSYLFSVRCLQD